MFVAIDVQISSAAQIQSGLSIALGVKLDELHAVGGEVDNK